MKKCLMMIVAASMLATLSGCISANAPIKGFFFTDVKGPLMVSDQEVKYSKVGTAEAQGIIGFAFGDASLNTAINDAGISKVTIVDSHTLVILNLFGRFKTVAYGN
jgi:hypothetical protein